MRDLGMVDAYAFAVSKGFSGTREEFAELMASYATVGQNAAASAQAAAMSENNAAVSAQTASTKASEATASAQSAASSAQIATDKATLATNKAQAASESATLATAKANAAATSETNATTAAQTATTKASEAAASATSAQQSAVNAQASATNAAASEAAAKSYAEDSAAYLGAYPTDTAEGEIASFSDGADDIPLKSLVVDIEPVQDLHGYDSPWPAGGGKNLFPLIDGSYETTTRNYTIVGGVVSATAKQALSSSTMLSAEVISALAGTNTLKAGTYTFSYEFVSGVTSQSVKLSLSDGTTVDNGSSFAIAEDVTITGVTTTSNQWEANTTRTFKLQIESGTSVTAWSPYQNICPISGWTGCEVVRTGKNLFNLPQSVTVGNITFSKDSDGYVSASPNNADSRTWSKDNAQWSVNLKAGVYQFVIQCKTTSSSQSSGWEIYNPSGTKIAGVRNGKFQTDEMATFTASSDGTYFIMAKVHSSESRLMIVKNGDNTAQYEAFGNTYSITFPDSASTVYGGSLDITNGVLTVDSVMMNMATISDWVIDRQGERFYKTMPNIVPASSMGTIPDGLICTRFQTRTVGDVYGSKLQGITISNSSALQFHINGLSDKADVSVSNIIQYFANNETIVVAKLITPIIYNLTPTEVSSLLGQNNIYADTGDTTVEYRADTSAYVAKKIAEAISALS